MFQYEKQGNEICENKFCASARIKQGLRYGFKSEKYQILLKTLIFRSARFLCIYLNVL